MSDLKRTALYARHIALRARMVPFAGWDMPVRYSGDLEEVAAVRQSAGLFDVSHMGQVELRGPHAFPDLNRLVTNDLARAKDGQALYTMMCNERGGVIDDLLVYRLSADHWFVVVNASRSDDDIAWMREHLSPSTALQILTPQRGIIAAQGPRAVALVQTLSDGDLLSIPRMGSRNVTIAGVACLAGRTGYTGEDGFELFPESDRLVTLWDALLEARLVVGGEEARALPCGLGARDTCRLEAGLRLYGNDLSDEITPLEAGLKWTVKFDKEAFLGKDALARQLAEGVPRRTIGLRMQDRSIPRHEYPVLQNGEEIGMVTSGIFSPTLKAGIAMALVRSSFSETDPIAVLIRGEPHPAEVVKMPFVRQTR